MVWYGLVLCGDLNCIVVGFLFSVGDKCVFYVMSMVFMGLFVEILIGKYCIIGFFSILWLCIVEDEVVVG